MRIAVLGASRGLGLKLVEKIRMEQKDATLFLSSRSKKNLDLLAKDQDWIEPMDFTKNEMQSAFLAKLIEFSPNAVIYCAGGGPYGDYRLPKWSDHTWALELNLIFPARMLHFLLQSSEHLGELKKIIVVGSKIAGRKPDPGAASYSAAKHGLVGLIESIRMESPPVDIQLFEPGYMDTQMLPKNAWPRQAGLAVSPELEASKLWQMIIE